MCSPKRTIASPWDTVETSNDLSPTKHSAMVGFMRIADLFDYGRAGTRSVHARETAKGRNCGFNRSSVVSADSAGDSTPRSCWNRYLGRSTNALIIKRRARSLLHSENLS